MKRSPEELFLLEFVKCCFGNGDLPTLEQHLSQTSWENILPVITAHELQALVYSRLEAGILPVKPPLEVLSHLRSATTQISMHNLIGESEGSRVISRLQEKEIFFLLLKGVPLMEMIYGQSWMRPASDVDILIHPADYSRVESLLLKDGFVHVVPEGFQDRTEDFLIIQTDFGEMHFFKPTSSLLFNLDVHWRVSGLSTQSPLLTLFPIDTYPWLANPGRGRFGRLSVPRLNNEMLFFHLVFHFALHHHLRGLRTFLDLCSFCSQYGESLDGDFLRHVVPEENCRKIVTLVLMFVRKYTGKDLTLHFLPPSPPPL
ncbi:MAG: nucleotidyltransferase family protein, partial [Atribacterota bacterium]